MQTDNIRAWTHSGHRFYDDNSNSHLQIQNLGFTMLQSYDINSPSPGDMYSQPSDNTNAISLNPYGGNVGIGTTTPN